MNSKRIAGTILAVVIAGGIGVTANLAINNGASAADKDSSTVTTSPQPTTAADVVLAPGAAGPVEVGTSKVDALATGLFVADLPGAVDGCPDLPLAWTKPFAADLDVQTLPDGEVASIGVRGEGPRTADDLGVGSTFAEIQDVYAGAQAVDAGYGQAGVLVEDGGRWIGFLFDAVPADVTADTAVTFVELTEGEAPSLMRDGC